MQGIFKNRLCFNNGSKNTWNKWILAVAMKYQTRNCLCLNLKHHKVLNPSKTSSHIIQRYFIRFQGRKQKILLTQLYILWHTTINHQGWCPTCIIVAMISWQQSTTVYLNLFNMKKTIPGIVSLSNYFWLVVSSFLLDIQPIIMVGDFLIVMNAWP